jgi:hypothetical protein
MSVYGSYARKGSATGKKKGATDQKGSNAKYKDLTTD